MKSMVALVCLAWFATAVHPAAAQRLDRVAIRIVPMQTAKVPTVAWNKKGLAIPLGGARGGRVDGWVRMFRGPGAGERPGTAKEYLAGARLPESDDCIQFIGFRHFRAHITPENVLLIDADLDDTFLSPTPPKLSNQRWVIVFEDNRSPDTRGIWIAKKLMPHYFASGIEVDIDAAGAKPLPLPSRPSAGPVGSWRGPNPNPFLRTVWTPRQTLDDPCLESEGTIEYRRDRLVLVASATACILPLPKIAADGRDR